MLFFLASDSICVSIFFNFIFNVAIKIVITINIINETINTNPSPELSLFSDNIPISRKLIIAIPDKHPMINENNNLYVVDNRNINNPENIGFIILPGNYDIATKDNYLYADSYLDLVVFDVSNLTSISEVNRVEGVFENYYINQGLYSEELGIVVGFDEEVVEEFIENYDCELAYD